MSRRDIWSRATQLTEYSDTDGDIKDIIARKRKSDFETTQALKKLLIGQMQRELGERYHLPKSGEIRLDDDDLKQSEDGDDRKPNPVAKTHTAY